MTEEAKTGEAPARILRVQEPKIFYFSMIWTTSQAAAKRTCKLGLNRSNISRYYDTD